jgi:hypothetical protein
MGGESWLWPSPQMGIRLEVQSLATRVRQARQPPARGLHGESRERPAIQHHVPSTTEARSRGMPSPAPSSIRASLSGFNKEESQWEEHHGFGTRPGDSRENTRRSVSGWWSASPPWRPYSAAGTNWCTRLTLPSLGGSMQAAGAREGNIAGATGSAMHPNIGMRV